MIEGGGTLGGGTLGGGMFKLGGGTELIAEGTGGGPDSISEGITFGGGMFGTLATETTID